MSKSKGNLKARANIVYIFIVHFLILDNCHLYPTAPPAFDESFSQVNNKLKCVPKFFFISFN